MADDQANASEGSDPSSDIRASNPGGTTTEDITKGRSGSDDQPGDDEPHKVENAAKAGRDDLDTDAGEE
ncbi:hypothetical protein HRV97_03255 [Sphingomonas sp. HHU CXW]|uniref:Uncharacterized protein n=1 Tax=Sphingomonas hominis TaxID=2741495 RepID=A0ABX2JET1_9SPHN|nr:hypothetical protein [Sphingomonas hominis]NTS64179.1 hypothetical protein [Sphingomonas hominis]